jgi:hypothetical protein
MYDNKINITETGMVCNMHGRGEKYIIKWWFKTRKEDT